MLQCLSYFCSAYGAKISPMKSKIYFSKNVSRELAASVSNQCQFEKVSSLGKYLGVPILQGCISKGTYAYILDKINQRLTRWTARKLSLAGHNALINSVLCSIPMYAMQTTLLPVSLYDDIDKAIRKFLWGSYGSEKKLHYVNWLEVCRPKSEGGLAIKPTRQVNKAFMVKLGWGLLKIKLCGRMCFILNIFKVNKLISVNLVRIAYSSYGLVLLNMWIF